MARKFFIVLLTFALIALPSKAVRAIPTGIGVIGDSASQAYQCIGRGNETSLAWTEILSRVHGINFGPGVCLAFNHAGSGEKINPHMPSQTADVLDDIKAGKIGRVIIMLGHNDMYAGTGLPDVPTLLAIYETNLNKLIKAGIAPRNILLIDISQENQQGTRETLVEQFNAGLRKMAKEKGTALSSVAAYHAELACRSTDDGQTYNVGGHTIYNRFGNEWHNIRLADGHLGTLANGILANTVFADFLGIPWISDAEILSLVGGEVIPSNPLPTCRGILKSASTLDGWLIESGENTNLGGTLNATANNLYMGDNAQKKQYRSILSFSTKELPDNAVITKVILKVKKQSIVGSGNPINILKGLMVDIKKGFFGSAIGLQNGDFQAGANQSYGPYKPALSNSWYAINLTPAKSFINKLSSNGGLTQIRLRFTLDDNNNTVANYLSLYSGNAPAGSRPLLVIEYHAP